MTNPDLAQRAIKYLHAVQVAPGRYAANQLSQHEPGRYVLFDRDALLEVAVRVGDQQQPMGRGDAFDAIMDADGVYAPVWWEPAERFAYRCVRCGELATYAKESVAAHTHGLKSVVFERITADLATGREIRA